MTRILILGGYGVFGSRLARILVDDARLDLIIAGRDQEKADQFVASLTGGARTIAAMIDTDQIERALNSWAPDLVVHCAGPFQGQDYRVAQACIAAGIHYADLSDGRAFVSNFHSLDNAARAAKIFALTAASTTSALSTAAAIALAEDFASVESICLGVTPGNRAPRGKAVVGAILSYVGELIPVLRNGEHAMNTGWGSARRVQLPGLQQRWFSPCDAPDMCALPKLFPDVRSVEFLAGLELSMLHLPLVALAQLRRLRIVPNLAGATSFFHLVASWFEPLGSNEGGMFVEMAGTANDGTALRRRWSLWAGAGDGPFIPAMAAAILARRVAAGDVPVPGARICAGDISLTEFEQEFSAFNINTKTETLT